MSLVTRPCEDRAKFGDRNKYKKLRNFTRRIVALSCQIGTTAVPISAILAVMNIAPDVKAILNALGAPANC